MAEAIWKSLTTRNIVLGSVALMVLTLGGLWLLDPDAFPVGPYTEAEPPGPELPADDGKPPPSEAERIARLSRSIEEQRKYLESLEKELSDPDSEFHKAEQHFQRLDDQRSALRRAIGDLQTAGKTAEAAKRETERNEVERRWKESLNAFNLALNEHKMLQRSVDAATRQLEESRQALARLTNVAPSTPPTSPHAAAPATVAVPNKSKPTEKSSTPPAVPTVPSSPFAVATAPPAASSTPPAEKTPAEHVSREVLRAREEAQRKEDDAKKAESHVETIKQRIEILDEDISQTKKLLDGRRKEADDQQKLKADLEKQLQEKTAAKAPEAELKAISERIARAQEAFQKELGEVRFTTDHLHDLQTQLSRLQGAQIRALHEAAAKKQAADAAEERIAQLQNPFRPRNIVRWLLQHGPRLLLIALGMFVFHRLARAFSRRVVQFMAQGTSKRGTKQDRENRAQTLAGVFNSALSMLILGGGSLMMLDEVGIPIVPLMGGAAVLGLAVAFGAQNLIKDYFSGFMVLLEDQYGINDVVRIGPISGLVEHISLRTTVLRDLEGVVHFIPHGTITTVSNQTHGWSRALFDVGIDYKEDIDHVMEVLLELGRELRREEAFADLILDDPEMLGVDNLADSSVILKFFIKTRPLQQWTIKREMLRRIKKRFGELGIEIPYPHQTVHHRYDMPLPPGATDLPPFARVA